MTYIVKKALLLFWFQEWKKTIFFLTWSETLVTPQMQNEQTTDETGAIFTYSLFLLGKEEYV